MIGAATDPAMITPPGRRSGPGSHTGLIELITASGLTGRGGAGFPVGRKLLAARGRAPRVIVNACEGEPLSIKDSWILQHDPEPLLQGTAALAAALDASRVVLAVHQDSPAHRLAAAFPGSLGGGRRLEVLAVPAGYVSSEASAVVNHLDGGRAVPVSHREPLAVGGRRRPATVVQNAETVYRIGQLASRGLDWFRSFGTGDEPGPRFASVSGAVAAPGVVSASSSMTVAEVVAGAGGSLGRPAAVLLGGYGGSWLPWHRAAGLRWSDRGLAEAGAGPGAGVVLVLGGDTCPLPVVARQLDVLASASARQCGPCLFGLPAVAGDWHALIAADAGTSADVESRLRGRLGLLPGRGGCHHPDGAARNAASALATFGDHLRAHRDGWCSATNGSVAHPRAHPVVRTGLGSTR